MEGWKCPGCGRCFSPAVLECFYCGTSETTTLAPHPTDPCRHLFTVQGQDGLRCGLCAEPLQEKTPYRYEVTYVEESQ